MDFSLRSTFEFIISLIAVVGVLFSIGLVFSTNGERFSEAEVKDSSFFKSEINKSILNKKAPVMTVSNMHYNVGDRITPDSLKRHVTVRDAQDGDISNKVKVLVKTKSNGTLDTSKDGKIRVQFSVENSVGLKTTLIKNILIEVR